MKLWDWELQSFTTKQLCCNIILSGIMMFMCGLLISYIYDRSVILVELIPTIIYFMISFIIWYQISPIIVKKLVV